MGIPGFTAERSLVGAHQRFGSARRRRGMNSVGGISPALARAFDIHHACFNLCRGGEACSMEECMGALGGDGGGGGGGGGGAGGGGGELVCGPCNKRTGLQRCGIPGKGFKYVRCGLAD